MTDIHALSGAYAVDALGDAERAQFEAHLVDCPACRAEVDSLRESAGLLADMSSTEPPAHLRGQVLASIHNVRPLPPQTPVAEEVSSPPARRRRWLPALAAAAAILTVIGVGVAVTQPWQDDSSQVEMTAAERVLNAPDARDVTLTFPDGAQATVTHSPREGRAVIVTADMPPAPDDKVYELWLIKPEGTTVPAGLMPKKADQTFLLEGDASDATAAAITVEPAGGSEQPTSEPIAVFDFTEQT